MGNGDDDGAAIHEQRADILPRIANIPLYQQEVGFMHCLLSRSATTLKSAVTDVASSYREFGEVKGPSVPSGRLRIRSSVV